MTISYFTSHKTRISDAKIYSLFLTDIDSCDKIADNDGYLYCVNTSDESYMELIEVRERLEDEGKICVFGGSYNNGKDLFLQGR